MALQTGKVSPLDIRTSKSSTAFEVDWFETTTHMGRIDQKSTKDNLNVSNSTLLRKIVTFR